MDFIQFIQQMINGLHVGSIYALIAIGYTMVYGIVRLINFAHGDILMVASYVAFICLTQFGLHIGFTIIIAMVVCATLGMLIDKIAYKPLRNAPRITALITAIGVSLFLQNLFLALFSPEPKKIPSTISGNISFAGLRLSYVTLVTIIVSIITMIILELIVKKTKTGKAMRAVSEDKDAARLMGINVDKTISFTFAIGSALGAIGGVLYCIAYPQAEPYMGIMPGLKAFVAAVLGGIGSIPGAMLGGYIMGLIEAMTKAYLTTRWANGIVFGTLILVLLFMPAGLLGKNVREKV